MSSSALPVGSDEPDEAENNPTAHLNGLPTTGKRSAEAPPNKPVADPEMKIASSPHKRRRLSPPADAPPDSECICGRAPRHTCRAPACRPMHAGDLLLIQENYTRVFQTKLTTGARLDTRYGTFLHDDLLGLPAGSRWPAARHARAGRGQCGGFMHAVRPCPSLWGASVAHRTQIVHLPDAALIALRLGLGAGDRVVEAGVGSAALAAQLAWAVGPGGSVSSYEFHAERAAGAREALAAAGLTQASVTVADVVSDGFPGSADADADAVFLDLPAPEKVLLEAARVLRPGKVVCCFSPCVEQVLRTCEAARACGLFHSLATVTAPVRTHDTRPVQDEGGVGLLEAPKGRDRAKEERREAEAVERHYGRVVRDEGRISSRPFSEMKGHTSFLTFATRVADSPVRAEKEGGTVPNGAGSACVLL